MSTAVAPTDTSFSKPQAARNNPGASKTTQSSPTAVDEKDKQLYSAIASKIAIISQAAKTAMTVTITIYIPTPAVGAVIGRQGKNILQLQKQLAAAGNNNNNNNTITPRVSVVGQHDPPDSIPYTYSTLDWSDSKHWTPVVIRSASAPASLAAATRVLHLAGQVHDGVVLDLPLPCQRYHAAIVGKRGVTLATLSADHHVRILVPRKELKHDMIQLEGTLPAVKTCLLALLTAATTVTSTASSLSPKASKTAKQQPQESTVLVVAQLPSHTKLRLVGRRTETTIRKKKLDKDDDQWQLTVTGTSMDKVEAAVEFLKSTTTTEELSSEDNKREDAPTRQRRRKGGTPKRNKSSSPHKASLSAAIVGSPTESSPDNNKGG